MRAARHLLSALKLPLTLMGVVQEKTKVSPGEKPETVKTHLRNMIIVPEMIGSMVGVYNGKVFNNVEIKVSAAVALAGSLRRSWREHLVIVGAYIYSPCKRSDSPGWLCSRKWWDTTLASSPSRTSL